MLGLVLVDPTSGVQERLMLGEGGVVKELRPWVALVEATKIFSNVVEEGAKGWGGDRGLGLGGADLGGGGCGGG